MAVALEAEAVLQENGMIREIGFNYDPTYSRILEVNAHYDESVSFAFTFWDNWVDASNHNWLYHEPFGKGDWPRFAREIAGAVRKGQLPCNDILIKEMALKRILDPMV